MTIGALSLLINSFIWRMWSSWVLIGGLAVFLQPQQSPLLLASLLWLCASGCALLWLTPQHWLGRQALLRPVALALGLAVLALSVWHPHLSWSTGLLLEFTPGERFNELAAWCSAGLTAVNLMIVVVLARRLQVGGAILIGALLLVLLLALATWITPAVSAALGLVLLGYGRGLPILTVLGALGLLLGLSAHYYALSWSLNLKAASMAVLGLVLLLARYLLLANPFARTSGAAP